MSGGQEGIKKARIKKIMQTDEEIGKVAAAVPVIISRALELFLESLLKKACQVTQSRNAKTMTTSHLAADCPSPGAQAAGRCQMPSPPAPSRKQCIELEQQFDFLKDLVASVPDMQGDGEDNHMDGDKGARRGRKPGSSSRKNGGMGSKGKDKKLSGTDSEQEDESEDTDTDGEEETPQAPPQASHPPAHFQSPPTPFMPFTSTMPLPPPPAPPGPSGPDAEDEEDYDS
ncbi:PREDICTED: dr1-associated corepressor isoform X1 [Myotis davidii]|uniref:dr1-associated corepressor isoform X1 n=1 Tax=Myotis davidii TaxID=225400 RepID=UPI000767A10C|nr:PREDICTED: dr1-associated corepressor isoform X1 [Myotis davidii]